MRETQFDGDVNKSCVLLTARHILDTSVTEREFVEQLHELNHKINFVKEQSFKDARSCLDVKDVLDKLKIKVSNFHVTSPSSSSAVQCAYLLTYLVYISSAKMYQRMYLQNLANIAWYSAAVVYTWLK